MTVNALVTGLIVFRVFKVFQQVKMGTADDQILGVTGGSTLRRVIFIIIESGMALFSIQLARLVVTIMNRDAGAADVYNLISGIHAPLNVIMTINHCYVILLINEFFLGYYTYNYLGAGINGTVFPQRKFDGGG